MMDARPRILLIGLGGTIVSTAPSRTEGRAYLPTEPLAEIVGRLPELAAVAAIEHRQLNYVVSPEIGQAQLLPALALIRASLATGDYAGIVVMHGTDTLEETAYFLDLTLFCDRPVVLTGAMRPASALSSDGPRNLYDAVRVAAAPRAAGRGVMAVLNGRILTARAMAKTHASALDAFVAPGEGPVGDVFGAEPRFYSAPPGRERARFDLTGLDALPVVDVVYGHQELRTTLFEAAIRDGARGIVFAATGNGTMSHAARHGARLAVESGVAFVRAARVAGEIAPISEDRELGMVSAGALNPQKARVLLRLALTRTSDRDEVQCLFDLA